MKRTLIFKDNINGKTIEKTVNLRDEELFKATLKYPAQVYKNKKIYTRKKKHKGRIDYDTCG